MQTQLFADQTAESFALTMNILSINYDDYFETVKNERSYAVETLKGYRRVLRTLFNEAVRYEWVAKKSRLRNENRRRK